MAMPWGKYNGNLLLHNTLPLVIRIGDPLCDFIYLFVYLILASSNYIWQLPLDFDVIIDPLVGAIYNVTINMTYFTL